MAFRIFIGTVAASAVALLAPGLAGASINWGTGVTAQLPSGAATSPAVALSSVSCVSAGNCAAAGSYNDTSVNTQGVLLNESGGTWNQGTKAGTPGNAAANPEVTLNSVSCGSAGNCAAVGEYYTSSPAGFEGLLLTQTSGTWATGVEATPPNESGNSGVMVNSVSCSSPGKCVAVGEYTDTMGHRQGVIETLSGGSWSAQTAPVPGGISSDPGMTISSVSCPSDGNCGAVGTFQNASGTQGLLLDDSAGTWTAHTASLPATPAANPKAHLLSVSCPTAGNCAAVGYYTDSASIQQGVMLNEASGSWATGVMAGVPSPALANPTVNLDSVSCASAGNCAAVGNYYDSSGHIQGLLLKQTSGTWATPGVEAVLPGPISGNPNVQLNSVSCISAGTCGAVGSYIDNSGTPQALLVSESSGAWGSAANATLPNDASPSSPVGLASASCLAAGSCAAVGRYRNNHGVQGLLLDTGPSTPPAQPTLSASAPGSGTVGTPVAASSLSATLSGGTSPTGTISFTVFGPQASAPSSCTSGGTSIGTATVSSGNATYHPSTGFTPSAAGHYWFYASYGGDGGNDPASSACGAAMPETVVTGSTPPPPKAPQPTSPPQITGPPQAGGTLGCSTGEWTPTPTAYSYSWSLDGTPIQGANSQTYVVTQLDEGSTVTCTVIASDAAGAGPPATSKPVTIAVPQVHGCPAATGSLSLHGATLGLARIGMTRAQARHVYSQYSTRGSRYRDYFCLTPRGIRVGYGSPQLLKALPSSQRHTFSGRVVWISTTNPIYSVAGVRCGATLAAAKLSLPGGNLIRIGLNDWYVAPGQGAAAVLKTRHGLVEEIGIGDSRLAHSRAQQRSLMASFS